VIACITLCMIDSKVMHFIKIRTITSKYIYLDLSTRITYSKIKLNEKNDYFYALKYILFINIF